MTTIGRVEYIAGIDGRRLPAQARKIGRQIGDELGDGAENAFSDKFDKILSDIGRDVAVRMRGAGRLGGLNFTDALERSVQSRLSGIVSEIAEVFAMPDGVKRFVDGFEDAGRGVDDLRSKLSTLREAGSLNDWQFGQLANRVNQYAADLEVARARTIDQRFAMADQELAASKLGAALDDLANRKMRDLESAKMRDLQFNAQLDESYRDLIETISRTNEESDRLIAEQDRAVDVKGRLAEASRKVTGSLESQSGGWRSLSHNTRQWILIGSAIAVSMEDIAVLGSAAGSGLTILAGAIGATILGAGTIAMILNGLNGELSEMPASLQPAAAAWQALGDAFGTLQDRVQNIGLQNAVAIFDSLRATVEGITPAFEVLAASAARVMEAFAASIAPGTQGFQQLQALIAAAGPIFETLADAAISFGGALGTIFTASIPYVEIFAGHLADLAGRFADWLNTFEGRSALEEWFSNGLTIFQALEPLIGAVADALASLVTPESIEHFVSFVGLLTEFMPLLSGMLAVIGDLNVLNIFAQILVSIGEAIQPILPQLSEFATILSESLMYAILSLQEPLTNLFLALAPMLPIIAQLAATFLAMAVEAIVPVADAIATQLIPQLIPLLESVLPLIPSFILLATTIGANLAQAIVALMPVIIPMIDALINVMTALIPIMPTIIALAQIIVGTFIAALTAATSFVGGLIDVVNAIISPFTNMGAKMAESSGYVDQLSDMINSSIGFFRSWGATIESVISSILGWISNAIGAFAELFGMSASAPTPGSSGSSGGGGGGFAAGGIASYAARRLTGEAGREAIVPLQRPLAQVDPSVRMLAAFAQGKLGATGAQKTVVFQEGAVIVHTVVPDGTLVAETVVDKIVAEAEL